MGTKKAIVKYDPDGCGILKVAEMASTALSEMHRGYEAEEMKRRVKGEAQSLDKALEIIGEYVTLKPIKKHRQ